MMVSDRFVENLSAPPTSGVSGERAPVVPGIPDVVVFSSLRVRPARTTTSPGAAQNTVSITSEVLSDNSLTLSRVVLKRVSVSLTSSLTVLLREKLHRIMDQFEQGNLTTHDDATLLVLAGQPCASIA